MYGHHSYTLELEIVQVKRDKEVRTKEVLKNVYKRGKYSVNSAWCFI